MKVNRPYINLITSVVRCSPLQKSSQKGKTKRDQKLSISEALRILTTTITDLPGEDGMTTSPETDHRGVEMVMNLEYPEVVEVEGAALKELPTKITRNKKE